jgi:rhodanese-related sulfurtransferase
MSEKALKRLAIVLFAVIVVLAALVVWGLSGTSSNDAATATPQVPVGAGEEAMREALDGLPRDLNVRTVDAVRSLDDVLIIDVRTPSEFSAGRVPGSINIPLDELASRSDEIPREETVVLTCRSGRRSNKGVDVLEGLGFENVSHMEGGMKAWAGAGLQTEQ